MDEERWEMIKTAWRDYFGLSVQNQKWLLEEFKVLLKRDQQIREIMEKWDIGKYRDHQVADALSDIYLEN